MLLTVTVTSDGKRRVRMSCQVYISRVLDAVVVCLYTRWLKKLPLLTGVEQAMKNWKGEKFRT